MEPNRRSATPWEKGWLELAFWKWGRSQTRSVLVSLSLPVANCPLFFSWLNSAHISFYCAHQLPPYREEKLKLELKRWEDNGQSEPQLNLSFNSQQATELAIGQVLAKSASIFSLLSFRPFSFSSFNLNSCLACFCHQQTRSSLELSQSEDEYENKNIPTTKSLVCTWLAEASLLFFGPPSDLSTWTNFFSLPSLSEPEPEPELGLALVH